MPITYLIIGQGIWLKLRNELQPLLVYDPTTSQGPITIYGVDIILAFHNTYDFIAFGNNPNDIKE